MAGADLLFRMSIDYVLLCLCRYLLCRPAKARGYHDLERE